MACPHLTRRRLGDLKVTVDFLMPPAPDQDSRVRVQNLQGDFGALITPGLQPKNAYDLVYVVRHSPGRGQAIAERLSGHAGEHRPIVVQALALLARDFDAPDDLGPTRAARFTIAEPIVQDELDNAAADANRDAS